MEENEITQRVIGAAIEVHRVLGPGLLEVIYEECLAAELKLCGLPFERQKALFLDYKGTRLDAALKIDVLVGGKVVVELKAVDCLLPIHEAQLLTYLRLTGCSVGLLINFNVEILKDGIRRRVLNFPESESSSAPSAPLR